MQCCKIFYALYSHKYNTLFIMSTWLDVYVCMCVVINPLNDSPTKRSNTLKKFVNNLQTNCLSVFDHFVGLGVKALMQQYNRTKDATESIDLN